MNATSSLERFPQAQAIRSALQAERIVHSQRELGVPEVLRLVDVVEEIVEPPAQDGREAPRELPRERGLQTGREREEGLLRKLGVAGEGARDEDEGDPRAQRPRAAARRFEIAPERPAAAPL